MRLIAAVALLSLPLAVPRVADADCTGACERRVVAKQKRRVVAPHRAWFERLARCESTSRWHLNTGNGFYGGVQFTISSWRAVGGRGWPHEASKTEQMYRGVRLLRLQGPGAWPVCSQMA